MRGHRTAVWNGAVLAELRSEGIAIIPERPAEEKIAEVTDFLLRQPVQLAGGELVSLDEIPPETPTAAYPLSTILACPGIMELLTPSGVLKLAEAYLTCKPTLVSLSAHWSFSGANIRDFEGFHRDLDDWNTLKLFIYLTDVEWTSGPHLYLRASHKSAASIFFRTYELNSREYAALRMIAGPAGTTFVADTYGIHAEAMPKTGRRLTLEAQYSLLSVHEPDHDRMERWNGLGDPYVTRLFSNGN